MRTIYFIDHAGKRITQEVTDEVADAIIETRRAEWRNDAKERYYRGRTLSTLTDDAIEYRQGRAESRLMAASCEEEYIATEDKADKRAKLLIALESLTPTQKELVKLLKKGMSISEIARQWGKHHTTISEIRKAVQKKFEIFL